MDMDNYPVIGRTIDINIDAWLDLFERGLLSREVIAAATVKPIRDLSTWLD